MDNKITKERIAVHFEYDWLKYILLLAVSIFVFYMVFYQINVTRDFESIDVFFTCYQSNMRTQGDDYLAYMNGRTREGGTAYNLDDAGNPYVIDATIEYQSPTHSEYGTLLASHGAVADVLIVTRSALAPSATGYLQLTDEILSVLLPDGMSKDDIEYFAYTDEELNAMDGLSEETRTALMSNRYGIRVDNLPYLGTGDTAAFVFDPETAGLDPETHESEFYLAIRADSLNLGDFNQKPKHQKKYGNKAKYGDLYQTLYYVQYFLSEFGQSAAG